MSLRGLKRTVVKSKSSKDVHDGADWKLRDDFDFDRMRKYLEESRNGYYDYSRKGALIFGQSGCKIKHIESKHVGTFEIPIVSTKNPVDNFFIHIHTYHFDVQYTDKVAAFNSSGKRISRNGRKFDLIDSEIKHSEFNIFGTSVGDIVKSFYHNSKYQTNFMSAVSSKLDEIVSENTGAHKVESVKIIDKPTLGKPTLGRPRDKSAENTLGPKDRKRVNDMKKNMLSSVIKTDYYDEKCDFLGYLSDGQIFKLVNNIEVSKTNNLEDLFRRKLLWSDNSLYDVFHNWFLKQDKYSIVRENAKQNSKFITWFFKNISTRLIDTLVMYFYMGQSLYVTLDEEVMFDEPISIKDWVDMIDPKWEIRGFSNKNQFVNEIFGKCNEREQEVLDAQEDLIVDNFKFFKREHEYLPPYAFRKLYFIRFSYKMVQDLADELKDAKLKQIVPKRWRGKQKMQAIRNEWKCYRDNSWKEHYDLKFEKNAEHYAIGNEGIRDFYDLLELSSDEHSEDNQCEYAYDLPPRINPELMDKDDLHLMEGELYKFMTDGEALAKAFAIDEDQSKSLNEKLCELNKIGYSRTGDDLNYQVYLLVPPGHQLRPDYTSMMVCEDFFVPHADRRLPRIVLMSLPDDESDEGWEDDNGQKENNVEIEVDVQMNK